MGGGGSYAQCVCRCVWGSYDLPWRRGEEQPGAPRTRGEQEGRVWLNGIVAANAASNSSHAPFCLFERVNMHTASALISVRQIVGIIQSKLSAL